MYFEELVDFLLLVIPLAVVVFFILSLGLFISDRVLNKKNPGSVKADKLHRDKIMLIISSILLGLILLLVIAAIIIFSRAVAYM